jgi:hypothetical protein
MEKKRKHEKDFSKWSKLEFISRAHNQILHLYAVLAKFALKVHCEAKNFTHNLSRRDQKSALYMNNKDN